MYISCLNKCRNVQIKEPYNSDNFFFCMPEKYLKGKSVDDTLDSFYINHPGFYGIIDLRHQYGISAVESQTFFRAKRPQRRRARRTAVFAGYKKSGI